MYFIWVGLALMFIIIGWGIHVKKWYFLISGYNMMSKEEKAQVDIEPLAKSLAIMAYIMAALLLLMGLAIHFELWTVSMIITGLMIVIPIAFVINGQKYTKGVSASGKSPKAKKISIIITTVTLLFVAVLLYFSIQPTKIETTANSLSISGMYGDDYAWTSIEKVELLTELPEIAVRTNGSAVGAKLKGNFKFKNGEKAVLFLDKSVPAFIRMETQNKVIIFNEPSVEETNALFEQIQQHMH